jgi:hypothetical protein
MGLIYVLQLLLIKKGKFVNNSIVIEAREKMSAYLVSLEFYENFDISFIKFEIIKFLFQK